MIGPNYDRLGYKRLIVDYHFSDFVPGTLVNANAENYVSHCATLGVDSVLVYGKDHWGNCYYATPNYPRHPNVPQDLFGEILSGLRQRNIVGYAYFSVGWDEHAVRKHPDWAMRAADGQAVRRRAPDADRVTGRWTFLCVNSPYRDYALGQIGEMIAQYDFPALFLDILFLSPPGTVCHCPACRSLWQSAHAQPLPTQFTPEYLDFAIHSLERFHHDVKSLIADSGKSIQTTHNFGLPYAEDDYVAFEVNPLGRNYVRDAALAKIMRAEADGREVELIGHRFNQDWDFTTKARTLMRWEAATVASHNCALMWVDQPLMDGSFDSSVRGPLRDSFQVVDDLAPHVRGSVPWAEVALLYASHSARLAPDEELDFVGAYRILTELHWPFDVISESHLAPERLKGWRLVIVPQARYLSASCIAALREYVHRGGNLIFTHQTATLGLDHLPLQFPGFGLVTIDSTETQPASFLKPAASFDLSSLYLRIEETCTFHTATPTEVWATHIEPNIAVTHEQWVSHNVAPGVETARASVVSGSMGKGRFIYAAPRLFAEYARQDLAALREFLQQLFTRVYSPTVWVQAPRIVEATFNRQGSELVICLVNTPVGRPSLGGILILREAPGQLVPDEIIPISGVRVQVTGREVQFAHDLARNPLPIERRDGVSTISLERLEEYAVIRLSLETELA